MFSIAGIPPLAGFFSKFLVLKLTFDANFTIFAFIIIIASVVAAFYYLRIVKIMYFDEPNGNLEIEDFGNARFARSLWETAFTELAYSEFEDGTFGEDELRVLQKVHVERSLKVLQPSVKSSKKGLGFSSRPTTR